MSISAISQSELIHINELPFYRQHQVDLVPCLSISGRGFECYRKTTGYVRHHQLDGKTFSPHSVPPIPPLSVLLNNINVTVLFLHHFRHLRQAGELANLAEETQEREDLAKYLIPLICSDDLTTWRDIPRPPTLRPIPAPPSHLPPSSIPRRFYLANFSGVMIPAQLPGASNPSEGEQRVLVLGGEEGATTQISNDLTAADTLVDATGDTAQASLHDSMDQDDASNAEETTEDLPTCKGCLKDRARRLEIEEELIPRVQGEMRQKFGERAQSVGTGRALEEVFFRPEGLQTYGKYRQKLEALEDDLDELQYYDENDDTHTCRRF